VPDSQSGLRRTVLLVAVLNLAYFGAEFAVAQAIGSVALVADSIDFLEDTSLNVLIFLAVGLSARGRSRAGSVLAFVILVPAIATLWTAVSKIADPTVPAPVPLTVTAFGALVVNLLCAFLLVRHRGPGSLARAAWLSARNDAVANLAMIAAALLSLVLVTGWIDIVVGLGIGLMNADAARDVWRAARAEAGALDPEP
jgi:Co/Zn/Cd efflux system component